MGTHEVKIPQNAGSRGVIFVEPIILKKVIDLLTDAIQRLLRGRQVRAQHKKSSRLISEAIAELLSVDPNLHLVQAKLSEAEANSPNPSEQLIRAQEMLQTIRKTAGKKGPKKTARKRAARMKVVKKKTARKKAAKR